MFTTIKINLKEDWADQIRNQGFGASLTGKERANGGFDYTMILGGHHADRILFHSFHKRDLGNRISIPLPLGNGTDQWTFKNLSDDVFYLAYNQQTSGKSSSQKKRIGSSLSGIGHAFKILDYASKKASSRGIYLSTSMSIQGNETHQIGADSSRVKLESTLFAPRFKLNQAFGSNSIKNRELGKIIEAWYQKTNNSPGLNSLDNSISVTSSVLGQIS